MKNNFHYRILSLHKFGRGRKQLMPRMSAIEAAVHVLEKEGVSVCFGVPGAAINPFYAALRA
jgi:hypothetical protein